MLEWLIGIGLLIVVYIVAKDMYDGRNSRPLSHMKPDPNTVAKFGWMEDQTRATPKQAHDDKKDKRHDR